jgi:thiosulfate/3-mercaptopyruvate sulfurtransferase
MGLLPDADHLSAVMSAIGLTPETHVVAYDRDDNLRAARFLWTLDAIGHSRYSLLDGGLRAWRLAHLPLSTDPVAPMRSTYKVSNLRTDVIADKHWILTHLNDSDVRLVDARTDEEYKGSTTLGGHIPGAVNYDYGRAIDRNNAPRLKSADAIRSDLEGLGVTPDKEIIVYCQTHRRSAHTYFVLKLLGYDRVRAYPGSWSEWGNDPAVPIHR